MVKPAVLVRQQVLQQVAAEVVPALQAVLETAVHLIMVQAAKVETVVNIT